MTDQLPSLDECNELTEAMRTAIGVAEDFLNTFRQLPSLDDLNELTEAMRTAMGVAEDFAQRERRWLDAEKQ